MHLSGAPAEFVLRSSLGRDGRRCWGGYDPVRLDASDDARGVWQSGPSSAASLILGAEQCREELRVRGRTPQRAACAARAAGERPQRQGSKRGLWLGCWPNIDEGGYAEIEEGRELVVKDRQQVNAR